MIRSSSASAPARMLRAGACLVALLSFAACSGWFAPMPQNGFSALDESDLARLGSPPIDTVCRIYRPGAGEVGSAALLARAAEADVVFLGELHTDETTHRLQLAILMALHARHGDVALAMEQFERDSQPALDDYLAGRIDERTFRTRARLWSNYDADYRPMIEFAKARGIPVIASNAATAVRRKLANEGKKAFEALSAEERKLVARELLPQSDAYWKRVEEATRGHGAMGFGTPEDAEAKLFSGQSVWDNTMAESIADSLAAFPDRLVIHVNGGFHSEYFDGTVAQLKLRAPDADVVTVATEPVDDLFRAEPPADAQLASFVARVARIASSAQDDLYSVRVTRDLEFRLHRPSLAKAPLLVCLPEEGVSAAETETLYRARFGKQAAILTIVPPIRDIAADLGESGRFLAGPGSFSTDVEFALSGARAAIEYALRRFDFDASKVAIVGAGEAGRVAVATAFGAGSPVRTALAIDPPSPGRIAELGGHRGDSAANRKVRVFARAAAVDAWTAEAAREREFAVDAVVHPIADDPWDRARQFDEALHDALGLPVPAADAARRHVALTVDSPRARAWAETLAARLGGGAVAVLTPHEVSARGEDLHASTAVDVAITPDALRRPRAIPRAPGAFGGTTLILVPASLGDAESWRALEKDDPLNKESRFHRLRVAFEADAPSLTEALAKLKEEGRKNVLIVPATFCASGAEMTATKASLSGVEADFTLSFSPGLGGVLVPEEAPAAHP